MSVGEVIAELRRKSGWSQEDLAYKLDVSRQSVSKWESGSSVPELEKIVKISEIFGVSTDYILKGVTQMTEDTDQRAYEIYKAERGRKMSTKEIEDAINCHKQATGGIANGVSMCIASPICLIIFAGLIDGRGANEKLSLLGVAILFVIVAAAVGILIYNGLKLSKFDFLEKEEISIEERDRIKLREKKKDYSATFNKGIVVGTVLCILGVLPIIVSAIFTEDDLIITIMVGILLLAVALAVNIFIRVGIINGVYKKILQEGEYTAENKQTLKRSEPFSGAYWCTITVIYLAISFIWEDWEKTWIICPVAGVAFGAIKAIITAKAKKNSEKYY